MHVQISVQHVLILAVFNVEHVLANVVPDVNLHAIFIAHRYVQITAQKIVSIHAMRNVEDVRIYVCHVQGCV